MTVTEPSTFPPKRFQNLYIKRVKGIALQMFQLQIKYNKTGNWENTVFLPMEKMKALDIMAMHNKLWSKDHCYRLIPAV